MTQTARRTQSPTAVDQADKAAPGPDVLPLDRQLCFSVYAAAHAFTAAYKPLLEPLGLTYPQYLVMLVLWEEDGLDVKKIAARLHLDSGTVTPLLKRLERDSLLRRGRDPANERHLRVELTDAGHALRWKVGAAREQIVCALGGTEEPLQALKHEIDRITALLERSGS
ncbi:MarR family transcriptional regulator [Methylobacterium sp. E-065]|uniref:MarR family winged helix-turn-helix transcriptional regulator n=1 Tax=Methylobacterium sp. E-065 TaxID=2836583 RepID=UPI001FB9712E|nr:MarR family transcriptional regulator [Methylobacterium sp. E-065]MCJ2016920.1 MarR family transcriptional regulator [Methylobacterium sp. E-065]